MDEYLVDVVREEAAAEIEDRALHNLQDLVDKAVKDPRPPTLGPVKSALRKTKKTMRTRSYYLCDQCNIPIVNYDDGYIFHGNVYAANPSERGGLIGNNFPDVTPGTSIDVESVEEKVFCHKCVVKILGLDKHYAPKQLDKSVESKRTDARPPVGGHGDPMMRAAGDQQHAEDLISTALRQMPNVGRRGEAGRRHWTDPHWTAPGSGRY
jgi:hypothetical protein